MSADPDLLMPRRLAILILHEAQIAQPESICGLLGVRGDGGEPSSFVRGDAAALAVRGEKVWARLWSNPLAPAVPSAGELEGGGLSLVVSLNTKGVLEMRAWELRGQEPFERVLKIRD